MRLKFDTRLFYIPLTEEKENKLITFSALSTLAMIIKGKWIAAESRLMNKGLHLRMNKIIGVLLFAFLASPQLAFNQECNANPGSLSLENTSFCKGELIQPSITNNNTAIEFVNELIVLDEQGIIVQAGITNGEITGLDWGNYTIHNLNYEAANPPNSPPVVGSKLTDIQDPSINCFDISTALNISVTDVVAPVAVCSLDPIELYLDVAGELNVAASDLDFGSFDDGCL